MSQPVTEKKPQMQTITANAKPRLLISDNFYKQAEALCKAIHNVEWSGIALYRVSGSVANLVAGEGEVDPNEFFIEALDIIPMDKGSAAYTEYKFGPAVIKYMNNLAKERGIDAKDLYSLKIGHIHSHVNMTTGFSGTDDGELSDNIGNHNGYLSIITNNRAEYNSKYAVSSSIKRTVEGTFTDIDGTTKSFTREIKEGDSMLVFTPSIVFEDKNITFEKTFLEAIKQIKEAPPTRTTYTNSQYSLYGSARTNSEFDTKVYNRNTRSWDDKEDEKQVISGNVVSDKIKNNITTTSEVFINFFKDFIIESYYSTIAFGKETMSMHSLLKEVEDDFKSSELEHRRSFINDIKAQIPLSYLSIMGMISDKNEKEMFVKDLKQVVAMVSSMSYSKFYPTVCKMIESACNSLIQTYSKEIKAEKV